MAGVLDKINNLTDKVDNAVQTGKSNATNLTNTAVSKLNDSLNSVKKSLNLGEKSADGNPNAFEIKNINIREKLKVNCPNFMKQCGMSQIDFGGLFLSTPGAEAAFAQAQGIINDAIDITNGVIDFVSKDTLIAIQDLITFIISDLISTILSYCTNVFSTYISPDFVIGLTKDVATGALKYTKENIKNPADILNELQQSFEGTVEKKSEESMQKMQNELTDKINIIQSGAVTKIKDVMGEIQKYSSEIAKYVKYGPDYAAEQVELIYKKYLNMGIGIANEYIGKLNSYIDFYVDFAAKKTGEAAARAANDLQTKAMQKIVKQVNIKKQKASLIAMSIINKVVMNLLGVLGG